MATKKTKPRGKRRPKAVPAPEPSPPLPSWIRAHVTQARRGGRPRKLNRKLIVEFLGYLERGIHLSECAALCGVVPQMIGAWLRQGRNDEEKGNYSIERELSSAVRAGLALLQLRGVDSLAVYQRMAEGWSPTCKACTSGNRPCGAHPTMLKLAADLERWRLVHRFPAKWSAGTMPAIVAGDAGELGTVPLFAGSSEGGTPQPTAFGAIVFLPARAADDPDL